MAMAERDATHAEAPETGTVPQVAAPGWIEAADHRFRIPVALAPARGVPDTATLDGPNETAPAGRIGIETPFRIQRAWAARGRPLELLREFEGTVQEVDATSFRAVFRDITDPSRPEEEGTIERSDVDDGDQSLIEPGAVFHWVISYELRPSKKRVSEIRFRRMPNWSEPDLRRARERASRLAEVFGVSRSPSAG